MYGGNFTVHQVVTGPVRPFRLHIPLIAAVLLFSYVVCHVGEGTLATMHSVSHELDVAWDYYVGGGSAHGHHTHGQRTPRRGGIIMIRVTTPRTSIASVGCASAHT